MEPVPVPWDCADGFFHAFWRRPGTHLLPEVRRGTSVWARVGPEAEHRAVLIDIEGVMFFDVEWEHVFLRLRFSERYGPLSADGLDEPARRYSTRAAVLSFSTCRYRPAAPRSG